MKNIKRRLFLSVVLILFVNLFSSQDLVFADEGRKLNLSNPNASQYTKDLFYYLKNLSEEEILFGQQHATDEGLTILADGNRVGSTESDVFNAVGDYPAIFGWDTNSLDGRERPGNAIDDVPLSQKERTENLAESMKMAHKLGGIVTLSMHPNNFVTGGNYNDTSGDVVREILPGGSKHDAYKAWLDNIVDLSYLLVDDDGQAIPIIFRPFHEQTGGWFWWGATTTSPEQYKAIFRYTVEYLHEHGNDNFLIGFSPGAGPAGDRDRYFATYPGDDYVDILGIDNYDQKNNAGSQTWINGLAADLAMLADEAEARGKISALTEFGYSAEGMNEVDNHSEWWTTVLDGILNHPDYPSAAKTAYMLTWANFGFPNNVYVPYKDVNDDLGGDHHLLANFTKFYQDDRTIFADALAVDYGQGSYETESHDPFMYVVSPTNGDSIISNPLELKARVVNGNEPRVTYSIAGGEEVEMKLVDRYYQANWSPSADYNESAIDITVRYYENDELINEETHRYYIYLANLIVKEWTFDHDIDGIQNNGSWPEDGVSLTLSHQDLDGRGVLALDVGGMPQQETWQELKLQLIDLEDFNIQSVNQLSYDAYLPVSLGTGDLKTIVQLPDDWDTKYEAEVQLADLATETIDGVEYYVYRESISFPILEGTKGFALSLVGDQLDMSEPIYIDNIRLENSYLEAPVDPFLVDDFEGYMGDDTLLNRAYGSNGDPIRLSLSSEYKFTGDYGLQYNYTLADQGYAGREISLGGLDWTGKNGVSFWMRNEGHEDQHLTLQINIGGVAFEAEIELDEPYEGIVEIPFSDFSPAHWEGNQDAIIDTNRIQKVASFALYMGGDSLGEGTLYFDEIRAVEIEGAPEVPYPDEAESVEPIVFDFETDLAGWDGPGVSLEKGHLRVDVLPGGNTEVKKTSGYDLSDYNYIVARLMTTKPLAAKLFIKVGSSWAWSDSGEIELGADGYKEMIFDISEIDDRDQVQEIGIEFLGEELEGNAKVLVDNIQIVNDLDELIAGEDSEEPVDPEVPEEDIIKELEKQIGELTKRLDELEALGADVSDLKQLLADLQAKVESLDLNDEELSSLLAELLARIEALEAEVSELEDDSAEFPKGEKGEGEESSTNDRDGNDLDNKTETESDQDGAALPSTATSMYNYLLTGILILIAGAGLTFYSYKRKSR